LIEKGVNGLEIVAESLEVGVEITVENLFGAFEFQVVVHLANDSHEISSFAVLGFVGHGRERSSKLTYREVKGVGEAVVEEQEVYDLGGVELHAEFLAKGFESGTALQESEPIEVAFGLAVLQIGLQQSDDESGAFQPATCLDELPGLIPTHGGVGEAVDEMDSGQDLFEELLRAALKEGPVGLAVYKEVNPVDLLPHFAGYALANLASVLTGQTDTASH